MGHNSKNGMISDEDQTVITSPSSDLSMPSEKEKQTDKKAKLKKAGMVAGTAVASALAVGLFSSFKGADSEGGEAPDSSASDGSAAGGMASGGDMASGAGSSITEWWQGAPKLQDGVVNDNMSFNQAFSEARKNLGAGGIFQWKGQTYGTFFQEECDENGQPLPEYLDGGENEPINAGMSADDLTSSSDTNVDDKNGDNSDSPSGDAGDQTNINPEDGTDTTPEGSATGDPSSDPMASNPEGSEVSGSQEGSAGDEANAGMESGDGGISPEDDTPNEEILEEPSILSESNTIEYDADGDGYAESVYVDVNKDGNADIIIQDLDHSGDFNEEEVLVVNEDALAEGAEQGNATAGEMRVDFNLDGETDTQFTDKDNDGLADSITVDANRNGDFSDEEASFEVDNSSAHSSVMDNEMIAEVVDDSFASDDEVIADLVSDDIIEEDSETEIYADATFEEEELGDNEEMFEEELDDDFME